eukprot:31490-Pelagococcus_subviridis.AAC.3
MRRGKSLRIGVHHADGVVWGPVYRTHLKAIPGSSPRSCRVSSRWVSRRTAARGGRSRWSTSSWARCPRARGGRTPPRRCRSRRGGRRRGRARARARARPCPARARIWASFDFRAPTRERPPTLCDRAKISEKIERETLIGVRLPFIRERVKGKRRSHPRATPDAPRARPRAGARPASTSPPPPS